MQTFVLDVMFAVCKLKPSTEHALLWGMKMADSESDPFAAGQTVYDRSGAKYECVEHLSHGRVLVRPILTVTTYEGDEEEVAAEAVEMRGIAQLSAKKPVQSIDAEVADAAARLAEIKRQIRDAESDLRGQEKTILTRVEKLKAFNGLERVEEFLDGKITHFVIRKSYYNEIEVKTFEELALGKYDNGRLDGTVKLLCLFGKTDSYHAKKPSVEWRLNHYYDGSGSWTTCQPATSEEEAKAIATQWVETDFATYLALPEAEKKPWTMDGSAKSARTLGITIPEEIAKGLADHKAEALRKNVETAEAALAKANAALAASHPQQEMADGR